VTVGNANRSGAGLAEIESVYRRRFVDFRRIAAAITRDPEAASDVVQDAFAGAVRRRRSFRRDGPLEAWLWRALVNTALNARRRPRPEHLHDSYVTTNGHEAQPPDTALQLAISLLPERQRLVLFLRYYADLDYRTIADALQITPGTVGATLNAAHSSLRRTYEEVLD
jgi:RNA polymerase sigma-70 factor (ECF subfamily)